MSEQMEFPETFERFAREYGFKDDKEVYTNGPDLIPIFRVKQWLEQDNKLRRIETDTAYECGKHAVLDKIRTEIEQVKSIMNEEIINHDRKDLINFVNGLNQSLVIIDKYTAESEE